MSQRPKLRAKTTKLIEENIGEDVCNNGFCNNFQAMILKAQATKENRIWP